MLNSSLDPKGRFACKELPTFFRPISDLFRPWLKCFKTKGFGAFGVYFSDLKWSEEIRGFSCKTSIHFVSLHCSKRNQDNREGRHHCRGAWRKQVKHSSLCERWRVSVQEMCYCTAKHIPLRA